MEMARTDELGPRHLSTRVLNAIENFSGRIEAYQSGRLQPDASVPWYPSERWVEAVWKSLGTRARSGELRPIARVEDLAQFTYREFYAGKHIARKGLREIVFLLSSVGLRLADGTDPAGLR
jgi:hypothetical protein